MKQLATSSGNEDRPASNSFVILPAVTFMNRGWRLNFSRVVNDRLAGDSKPEESCGRGSSLDTRIKCIVWFSLSELLDVPNWRRRCNDRTIPRKRDEYTPLSRALALVPRERQPVSGPKPSLGHAHDQYSFRYSPVESKQLGSRLEKWIRVSERCWWFTRRMAPMLWLTVNVIGRPERIATMELCRSWCNSGVKMRIELS